MVAGMAVKNRVMKNHKRGFRPYCLAMPDTRTAETNNEIAKAAINPICQGVSISMAVIISTGNENGQTRYQLPIQAGRSASRPCGHVWAGRMAYR